MNNKVIGDWVECLSANWVNLTKSSTYKVTGVSGELFEIYDDIGSVRSVRQDSHAFKLIKGNSTYDPTKVSVIWGDISITDFSESSDIITTKPEPEDTVYPKYKSDVPWG